MLALAPSQLPRCGPLQQRCRAPPARTARALSRYRVLDAADDPAAFGPNRESALGLVLFGGVLVGAGGGGPVSVQRGTDDDVDVLPAAAPVDLKVLIAPGV